MKSLVGTIAAVGLMMLVSACGKAPNDPDFDTVAFTPIPTRTPLPKLCGNGVLNVETAEECESDSDCSNGASCVCCLCLADGEELGERPFSVARPPSKFLSTGLNGGDVSSGTWLPGPIAILAGRPDPNAEGEQACTTDLSIAEDTILGFNQPLGVACTKLFAAGSGGVIDCDGGTAHDVNFTQDSNGSDSGDPPIYESGLGNPITAGPGAATLSFEHTVSVNVACNAQGAGCNAQAICLTLDYENPLAIPGVAPRDVIVGPLVLTTGSATGTVLNPLQGGSALEFPVPVAGRNFTCSTWSDEDGVGRLVGPIGALDALGVLDTINMFLLEDRPE